MILLLFLGVYVGRAANADAAGPNIIAILIVKAAVGHVVGYLAHALRIHGHRLVGLLRHPEHLAHLGGGRRRAAYPTLEVAFLD